MRISEAGIEKIKRHEALRLVPYKDEAGKWTIGYGHLLKPGEWWDRITEAQAEDLLRQDLAEAEAAVNQAVKVPINSNQYDALVSFVFNVGVTAFRNSTLLKRLNDSDYVAAAAEMLRWNKITVDGRKVVSAGLSMRRSRERELFLA